LCRYAMVTIIIIISIDNTIDCYTVIGNFKEVMLM